MLRRDGGKNLLQALTIIGDFSRVLIKSYHGLIAGRQEVQIMLILEDAPEVPTFQGIFIRNILFEGVKSGLNIEKSNFFAIFPGRFVKELSVGESVLFLDSRHADSFFYGNFTPQGLRIN